MVIGLDVDGVLRKLPLPIRYLAKYTSPFDIFERAEVKFVKHNIFGMCRFIPFILDRRFVEQFQNQEVVIISSRKEDCEKIYHHLKKYLKIKAYYCRGNRPFYEKDWKLRCCKKEKISVFFEVRKYVIEYLRRRGIRVIEV